MNAIPLFPLSNALFPEGVMHLRIFEVRYLDMVKKCIADGTAFGVVPLLSGQEVRSPESIETFSSVGTLAKIESWDAPAPALITLRCRGTTRFRLTDHHKGPLGLWQGHAVEMLEAPPVAVPDTLQPTADALGKLIANLQREGIPNSQLPVAAPFKLDEAGWVADRWAELMALPPSEKERLLSMEDAVARLQRVQDYLGENPFNH